MLIKKKSKHRQENDLLPLLLSGDSQQQLNLMCSLRTGVLGEIKRQASGIRMIIKTDQDNSVTEAAIGELIDVDSLLPRCTNMFPYEMLSTLWFSTVTFHTYSCKLWW